MCMVQRYGVMKLCIRFFLAQDRSYFEHKLKAGSLCQACFVLLHVLKLNRQIFLRSLRPAIVCDFVFVVVFSLCKVFGLFFFVRVAPSLLRCFALRDFGIFFAWLCRCFAWACLSTVPVPLDHDSSLYWRSYLLLPITWPLLCFQVNDASHYVIMGIDNKLNILRFGQTCPCLGGASCKKGQEVHMANLYPAVTWGYCGCPEFPLISMRAEVWAGDKWSKSIQMTHCTRHFGKKQAVCGSLLICELVRRFVP